MKFINYLTSIAGIEIFPLISLLIFFSFFVAVGVYLVKANKDHLKKMEEMPLENNDINLTH
jgi:cytochrome c oxidase cbb3-type subunit IV